MKNCKHLRVAILLLVVSGLLSLVGCAKGAHVTPQYNAAVAVDDFASTLNGLQNTEIQLYSSGADVIDKSQHVAFQQTFKQAFQLNDQAVAAVAVGDFTSARSYMNSALALLSGLKPQLVNIKNANSQQLFTTALTTATTVLQNWINSLPPQKG